MSSYHVYWDWRRYLGTLRASSLDAALLLARARWGHACVVSTLQFTPRTETRP